MKENVLENPVASKSNFNLNVELKELTTNGIVNFYPKKDKNNNHSLWNGEQLKIPVYGVYKVSWGFYQNSINTFYKDLNTELALVTNNEIHEEKAIINKETPSLHAVKESHKTVKLLLRENEILSLNAQTFNADTTKLKDVYLKVEKIYVDRSNKFGYEN